VRGAGEQRARELLRQRRGPRHDATFDQAAGGRARHRQRIDARVGVEAGVLGGQDRPLDRRAELVEREPALAHPALIPELRQDRPAPIGDRDAVAIGGAALRFAEQLGRDRRARREDAQRDGGSERRRGEGPERGPRRAPQPAPRARA
jgi:hypothetical protein